MRHANLQHRHLIDDKHVGLLDALDRRTRHTLQGQVSIASLHTSQYASPRVQSARSDGAVLQQARRLVGGGRDARSLLAQQGRVEQRSREIRLARAGLAQEENVLHLAQVSSESRPTESSSTLPYPMTISTRTSRTLCSATSLKNKSLSYMWALDWYP